MTLCTRTDAVDPHDLGALPWAPLDPVDTQHHPERNDMSTTDTPLETGETGFWITDRELRARLHQATET